MPPVTHAPSPERFAKAWNRRNEVEQEAKDAADGEPGPDQLEKASQRAALVSKLIGAQGYGSWQAMLTSQRFNS